MSVASRYPKFGQFNAAIGSRVPNSIEKYPEYQKARPNRELLKREQLDLLHILREKMHLDVTELVPEEKTPLCCFVEDLGKRSSFYATLLCFSTIQNENIRSGGFIKTFLLMSFVSG